MKSRAIVLSRSDFGEADQYIQFLTQKWGVISTLARSSKKSKRRYIGGLDLFCHDEIFIRGDPKERPYLNELVVLNNFGGIRENLEKVLLAGKLLQWIKKLGNITQPMPRVYSLMGQTLALLEKESEESRHVLLFMVFKIRLLSILGIKPQLDSCVRCENDQFGQELNFDIASGGVVCPQCSSKKPHLGSLRLSQSDREFMRWVENFSLREWEALQYAPDRTRFLGSMMNQFASYHTQTRLP